MWEGIKTDYMVTDLSTLVLIGCDRLQPIYLPIVVSDHL